MFCCTLEMCPIAVCRICLVEVLGAAAQVMVLAAVATSLAAGESQVGARNPPIHPSTHQITREVVNHRIQTM